MSKVAVKGRIERYLSGPTADGFAIVKLKTPKGTSVTIKGKDVLVGYSVGETIEVTGVHTKHPRFGDQIQAFSAVSATTVEAGLGRWIAEAGIEGVGPATSAKLIRAFGDKALDEVIAGSPTAHSILGAKFEKVKAALVARWGEAKHGALLASYDIGKGTRAKIYERYGDQTGTVIAKQPYRLISDITGIAFSTADKIAVAAGLPTDSIDRMVAAAIDTLRSAEDEGHSYLTADQIIAGTAKRCEMNPAQAAVVTKHLDTRAVSVRETSDGMVYALSRLAVREAELAIAVVDKMAEAKRMTEEQALKFIEIAERQLGKELSDTQRKAAVMALVEPISIISGDPGTGKTTTLAVITLAMRLVSNIGTEVNDNGIGLAAPTGKAAQRMGEATKLHASTLHLMLGADGSGFRRDENNPLTYKHLAIDEMSMTDIDLAFATASAWGKAQVLLIGDKNQLASVGAGRVFGDLIESGVVPTVTLTEIRRQAEGSQIALGAQAVRNGEVPEFGGELEFVEANDNVAMADIAAKLHADYLAAGKDVQVLTPGHATEMGTMAMNERLANDADHDSSNVVRIAGGAPARVGDKVIQLENDKDRKVFNGDSGNIVSIIGDKEPVVTVRVGSRLVNYTKGQLGELGLAYALTVHKTQGSEYDVVVMLLSCSHWMLLRRSLLNTGMTRGKSKTIIVGQKRALRQAISNDDGNQRQTTLVSRLREFAA